MPDPLPGMPREPDRLTRRSGLRADERHLMGDHRSCGPDACAWAAQWRGPILTAAMTALDDTDRPCAVACLACADPPRILGTTGDLWSGKGWRNSHRRRHDLTPPTPAQTWWWKSMVLCVQRDEDGSVHLA